MYLLKSKFKYRLNDASLMNLFLWIKVIEMNAKNILFFQIKYNFAMFCDMTQMCNQQVLWEGTVYIHDITDCSKSAV